MCLIYLFHFALIFSLVEFTDSCAATKSSTTPTTTAASTGCQSCTLDTAEVIMISAGTKDFTSDTIDYTGDCAVRTSVCDGNSDDSGVIISYNRDELGTDQGTGSVTSVLTCNDSGQWEKQGYVITAIECQST